MGLSPKEQKLVKQLTKRGLLNVPNLTQPKIPAYKAPKLPTRLKGMKLPPIELPKVPTQTTPQDYSNYLLTHTSGDTGVARMFGKSLVSREGVEEEKQSVLGKLFDTLDITSDIGLNTADAIADTFTGEDSALDNVAQVGKGILGGAIKLANDTVLRPAHGLANLVGYDEFGDQMDSLEEKLLPEQEGRKFLEERGVKNKVATAFGGLALDIGLDPLTYLGIGVARGIKAPKDILDAKAAVSNPTPFIKPKSNLPAALKRPVTKKRAPLDELSLFEKWLKSEQNKLLKSNEIEPGHVSFANNREAGRRVSRLKKTEQNLIDAVSARFHEGSKGATSLDDLLDDTDLINEFRRSNAPLSPGTAEEALRGSSIPNLNMQLPKIPRLDVKSKISPDKHPGLGTPRTRRLQRKLRQAKIDSANGLTKGQEIAARTEDIPNPTRGLVEKLDRAQKDWERAMVRSGQVVEKGTKFSVRSANEIADKIVKGEIPRVLPIPKAAPEVSQVARTVADDFIDTLKGPKRIKGQFAKRLNVVEVSPARQIALFTKVGMATGRGIDDGAISALRAAEDQMIALGVQPVWHNGIRVRLSDVLQSTVSTDAGKVKQLLPLNEVLADFIKADPRKMNPIMRSVIHGLSAQRSANMSELMQDLSKMVAKAKTSIDENYMGAAKTTAEKELISSSITYAKSIGLTNKESKAIAELVKDHVDITKLGPERWMLDASNILAKAVAEGRAQPELLMKFQQEVAKAVGVAVKGGPSKITGNAPLDMIMTSMATWWGKGQFHKGAQSIFKWGEDNAKWRARTMRHLVQNYSRDERKEAWKIATGALKSDDPRLNELVTFIHNYFAAVLKNVDHGKGLSNATNQELSVAQRSLTMMKDVNRALKDMNGAQAFQFTNSRRVRDAWDRPLDFSQGDDWMKSWVLRDPDDFVNHIYDIDLALERTTKEYAFLDNFAWQFGTTHRTAENTFQMSFDRIGGIWVPDDVGRQMTRVMNDIHKGAWRASHPMARFHGKALRAWKTGVTIYLPSHHIRNAIGDVSLMWWAGHNNPYDFVRAKRIMFSQRGRYNQAVKAGDFDEIGNLTDPRLADWASTSGKDTIIRVKDKTVNADQLYVGAFQRGLLPNVDDLEDIFGEQVFKSPEWMFGGKGPLAGKAHHAATKASEYRDHYIRIAHFTAATRKNLKAGKTLENAMDEAAFEVRKWHPDGRDLTRFEQKYMRNIVPFYSWLRKSTPLLFEALMTRPAKIMAYPRGMAALQQSLGIDASLQDPFPDDQLFPEWIRGYEVGPIGDPRSDNPIAKWWGLLGRNMIGLDGKPTGYSIVNPGNPFMDTGQQFLGFGVKDTGAGLLESITPFLKVPIDLTKNSDFTGAPITQDEGGQGVLHYLSKQLPMVSPIQRVTDFGNREREGLEPGYDKEALINMLTALRVIGTGPYVKGAEFELEELLRNRNK